MKIRLSEDDDVPVPPSEPDAEVDWTGAPALARDLTGADWGDTTGDHRWRSLDPTFTPEAPWKGWEP